jgi:hypothetical protein
MSFNDQNNKRQGGDTLSYNNSEGNSHTSKGMSFVFRKAEKLTTALYMVTDIMPEREPMKWKMRETAVELLSGVTTSMSATLGEKMSSLTDVLKKIDRLVSFLEIAQSAHMLSVMNASVLKKEYTVLKSSVEYEWTKIFDRDKGILHKDFFHIADEPKLESKTESGSEVKKIGQSLPHVRYIPEMNDKRDGDRSSDRQTVREERPVMTYTPPKKEAEKIVSTQPTQRHAPILIDPERMHGVSLPSVTERVATSRVALDDLLPERRNVDAGKSDRRTIILALIKQKPALGVKDFVKSIPDVSEKTIQRELLAMVAEGALVKRGERRWSTYSLPNQ